MDKELKDKPVRLHLTTLDKLEKFRIHPRETPDDLINNAIKLYENILGKMEE
jgi:hypothetical protein